ncbi:MAG: hypothetical protein WDM86_20615 [Rhizomicrobium sp.]
MDKITMTAFALGTALFATAALADGMSANNTVAPSNTMAPASANAMAPASGGMMADHKPKPKKHPAPVTGGMMAPTNTMAPSNAMSGSH